MDGRLKKCRKRVGTADVGSLCGRGLAKALRRRCRRPRAGRRRGCGRRRRRVKPSMRRGALPGAAEAGEEEVPDVVFYGKFSGERPHGKEVHAARGEFARRFACGLSAWLESEHQSGRSGDAATTQLRPRRRPEADEGGTLPRRRDFV